MKLILLCLLLICTARAFATDALSLEEATKIAKQRAKADNLPDDHLVIHLVDWLKDKPPFYVVYFDPQVPDPSAQKENAFVGYDIQMDGTLRKTTITTEKVRVKAPFATEERLFVSKPLNGGLLDKPFELRLNTAELDTKANH